MATATERDANVIDLEEVSPGMYEVAQPRTKRRGARRLVKLVVYLAVASGLVYAGFVGGYNEAENSAWLRGYAMGEEDAAAEFKGMIPHVNTVYEQSTVANENAEVLHKALVEKLERVMGQQQALSQSLRELATLSAKFNVHTYETWEVENSSRRVRNKYIRTFGTEAVYAETD